MKGYLFDANVLSEFRKPVPDPIFEQNVSLISPDETYLSTLTFFELRKGAAKKALRDPRSGKLLHRWIDGLIIEYNDRIFSVSRDIAEAAGRLSPRQPLPEVDSLLAATARINDLCVVTRNVDDFARSGVAYLTPFEAPFRIHN